MQGVSEDCGEAFSTVLHEACACATPSLRQAGFHPLHFSQQSAASISLWPRRGVPPLTTFRSATCLAILTRKELLPQSSGSCSIPFLLVSNFNLGHGTVSARKPLLRPRNSTPCFASPFATRLRTLGCAPHQRRADLVDALLHGKQTKLPVTIRCRTCIARLIGDRIRALGR